MTIYKCDMCSKEDGEEYPPCVFVDTMKGANEPQSCPYANLWNKNKACKAEWVQVDEMPDGVM